MYCRALGSSLEPASLKNSLHYYRAARLQQFRRPFGFGASPTRLEVAHTTDKALNPKGPNLPLVSRE